MKKTIITLLCILIILIGCTQPVPPEQPSEVLPKEVVMEKAPTVELGDLIELDFVLSLENDTVVDTNNKTLARMYNVENYVDGPFKFIVGQSGKVAGFDKAILGLNLGESRDIIIEPSEKEFVARANKTRLLNRVLTINRAQAFPIKIFESSFGKKPVIGETVFNGSKFVFKYKVTNITDEAVITEMVLKEGENYALPNTEWRSEVLRVAKEDAMFYQKPKENQILKTQFGDAIIKLTTSTIKIVHQPVLYNVFSRSIELTKELSIPQKFQIVEVTDETFTIKRYHYLPEKRLKLNVRLLNLTKQVKTVESTSTPLVSATSKNA